MPTIQNRGKSAIFPLHLGEPSHPLQKLCYDSAGHKVKFKSQDEPIGTGTVSINYLAREHNAMSVARECMHGL